MDIQEVLNQLSHIPSNELKPHKEQLQEILKATVTTNGQVSKDKEPDPEKVKQIASDIMR